MKKSVEVTLLLAIMGIVIAFSQGAQLTGMQGIDVSQLPAPPSPPGMMEVTAPQPEPEPVAETTPEPEPEEKDYVPVEVPPPRPPELPVVTPQPQVAAPRVDTVDFSELTARVDAIQSKVDAHAVDIENLKQMARQPSVDQPVFMEGLAGAKRNTILSISLSLLVFALLIGIVALGIVTRKKDAERNHTLLLNYLRNYTKAGYRTETLRMHLRACGWPDAQIQRAITELKK